jgi:hypothetical protein
MALQIGARSLDECLEKRGHFAMEEGQVGAVEEIFITTHWDTGGVQARISMQVPEIGVGEKDTATVLAGLACCLTIENAAPISTPQPIVHLLFSTLRACYAFVGPRHMHPLTGRALGEVSLCPFMHRRTSTQRRSAATAAAYTELQPGGQNTTVADVKEPCSRYRLSQAEQDDLVALRAAEHWEDPVIGAECGGAKFIHPLTFGRQHIVWTIMTTSSAATTFLSRGTGSSCPADIPRAGPSHELQIPWEGATRCILSALHEQ